MNTHRSIAGKIPDIPRWVEARDLLLLGECEIFGLREDAEPSLVIRDPEMEFVFVIGTPALSAVHEAIALNLHGGEIIAPVEQGAWLQQNLPGWSRIRVFLHLLAEPARLPSASAGELRFIDPEMIGNLAIPEELLRELEIGVRHSPVVASFVKEEPVAFCYAGAETESLWDVSIDTLPEYQRQGHAGLCAAFMIRYMQARGKQAVWASAEDNPASWRLAQKLGFTVVDEILLFHPPGYEA